jgi:hypothetical protein
VTNGTSDPTPARHAERNGPVQLPDMLRRGVGLATADRPRWNGRRDCGPSGLLACTWVMTDARDELHRLVERLPEDQVSAALIEVQRLAAAVESPPWPAAWFGMITAGRADVSERVDELLAEGFGR